MSVPDFEVWGMFTFHNPNTVTYGVPDAEDVGTRTSNVRSIGIDISRSTKVVGSATAEAASRSGRRCMIVRLAAEISE